MSETLLRQWEMLRSIPRAPAKVTVATLLARLGAAGFKTTKRTVQRELNMLSTLFPLTSDDRSIPYGWSWASNAPAFDLPTMDGPTALTVRMIEQFIPTLLPPIVRDQFAPQFVRARAVLDANPGNALSHWANCIRVVPREMPLLPPTFNNEAVRVVYDALLAGKRFTAEYRSRTADTDEIKSYEVNPLGLVARGTLLYLVCTLWNYQDIRQLALHRVVSAALNEKAASNPGGFDLDRYIGQGEFQYPVGPMIQLKARFARATAAHLYETPLSEDQVIENLDADHVIVTATVRDTEQLEWWLLGFGEGVTVQGPPKLRERIIGGHQRAARQCRIERERE
jgi:predicted DNA-binding transcriptional regulator YafY